MLATETISVLAGAMSALATAPTSRLHHHAFVVVDEEATRAFHEDLQGFPLVATWREVEVGDRRPDDDLRAVRQA